MIYDSIYEGSKYSLDPKYGLAMSNYHTKIPNTFSLALDPRTANQLKETADKLNTGAKQIEVQGVFTKTLDAIPEQHLDEIRRQAKLTGSKLSFHGPLEEPSGFNSQANSWDESNRQQAERQFLKAIERGQKLDPEGNIVITFHSTAQLPEMLQRQKIDGKEKTTSMFVVDSRTGKVGSLKEEKRYFPQEKDQESYEFNPHNEIKRINRDKWTSDLQNATYHLDLAEQRGRREIPEELQEVQNKIDSGELKAEEIIKTNPELAKLLDISKGGRAEEVYLRTSYNELKGLYDEAYHSAVTNKNESDRTKLDGFRKLVNQKWDQIEGREINLRVLRDVVEKGIDTLKELDTNPEIFEPFQNFVVDKSADTFSNVAFKSFKKFGNKAPVISIENPPAGGGLSRAEDLKKLIETSREKFVKKLRDDGYTKTESKAIAEKLIGATWDVGHINMIRKYGYDKEDLLKEAKTIKPFLKHIHLSDNFGDEHTELPMGMGNVPMEETAKIFGDKFANLSKVIETGDWYQHFKTSPFVDTLSAFGTNVSSGVSTYEPQAWNQVQNSYGSYFPGYGTVNPDIHHSLYGRGFAALPQELGGQVPGAQGSRATGTPMA